MPLPASNPPPCLRLRLARYQPRPSRAPPPPRTPRTPPASPSRRRSACGRAHRRSPRCPARVEEDVGTGPGVELPPPRPKGRRATRAPSTREWAGAARRVARRRERGRWQAQPLELPCAASLPRVLPRQRRNR
eukprot:scaffold12153_cov135-Isochrysis_galbana.AAC.3